MKNLLLFIALWGLSCSLIAQNKSSDLKEEIEIIEKAAPYFGKMYTDYIKHQRLWVKSYKENGYTGQQMFIKEYQKWFEDFGVEITTVEEGKKLFEDNKDKIKDIIKSRAKAAAALDIAIEKYSKAFILEEKAKLLK